MHYVESLNKVPLAEWLKQARGDVSMRELARRSQLSAAQISRLESGEISTPSVETLTQIARALGRNPELLLIIAGKMHREDALQIVERALLALPAGTARDLAGAWHHLRDLEAGVTSLDDQKSPLLQAVMCEIDKRSPNERADILETDTTRRLLELEQKLAPERDRLDGFVRACAGRLFAGPFPSFPTELLYPGMQPADPESSERTGPDSPPAAYWKMFTHLRRPGRKEDDPSEQSQPQAADASWMTWSEDPRARELLRLWGLLTPERQTRVLDFVEDQHRLSLHERVDEIRSKGVDTT